jgi:hypothetical protein
MENEKAISLKKQKEALMLTTSKLAQKLEIKTNELNKKFVELGYLEKKNKDYHLTQKGKEAGGIAKSNGTRVYILWDENMQTKIKGSM